MAAVTGLLWLILTMARGAPGTEEVEPRAEGSEGTEAPGAPAPTPEPEGTSGSEAGPAVVPAPAPEGSEPPVVLPAPTPEPRAWPFLTPKENPGQGGERLAPAPKKILKSDPVKTELDTTEAPAPTPEPVRVPVVVPVPVAVPVATAPLSDEEGQTGPIPWPSSRSSLVGSVVGLVTSGLLGRSARWARGRLLEGLLSDGLAWIQAACWVVAALSLVGLADAMLPTALRPVLPWLLVGAALAAGFSGRVLLSDALAGVVMRWEGRLKRGDRLVMGRPLGVVVAVGWRSTWVKRGDGEVVSIPNRNLLAEPWSVEALGWPWVVVPIPGDVRDRRALRAVIDGALRDSPYVAPGAEVEWVNSPDGATSVRVRLLEPRFAQAFASALGDRIAAMGD